MQQDYGFPPRGSTFSPKPAMKTWDLGRDVYYHTGNLPIKNDDGDDFLFYCQSIRRELVKKMKPGKSQATVKIPTSNSQFNALWDHFLFAYSRRSIPVGSMNFAPDPNNITECERMLLYGFTKKGAVTNQLLAEYKENPEPIPLEEGRVNSLKRKLATMLKQDSTDPALKYVKVEKSKTGALPFGIYTRGLNEQEMDSLVAIIGPLETKYMRFNRERFNIVFVPSKFQTTITFTFENKTV